MSAMKFDQLFNPTINNSQGKNSQRKIHLRFDIVIDMEDNSLTLTNVRKIYDLSSFLEKSDG